VFPASEANRIQEVAGRQDVTEIEATEEAYFAELSSNRIV